MYTGEEVYEPFSYKTKWDREATIPVKAFRYSLTKPFQEMIITRDDFFRGGATSLCVGKKVFSKVLSAAEPVKIDALGLTVVEVKYSMKAEKLPKTILNNQAIFQKYFPELFENSPETSRTATLVLAETGWIPEAKYIHDEHKLNG